MRENVENVMDFVFPGIIVALWALLAFGPVACVDFVTPPECAAYCELIGKWANACGKPAFNVKACIERQRHVKDSKNGSSAGLECWKDSVDWLPNGNVGEFDCAKMRTPRLP